MIFNKEKAKEIEIEKFLEDLPGLEELSYNPRSFSPERLRDACNNIRFSPNQEIDPIENLTCQFIFRNFSYIMHQTGLYNPQRKLFDHIASTERVVVKEYKKLNKEQKALGTISDLYFYDIDNRFILVRLEHPSSQLDLVALPKLFSDANNSKCVGAIYISNKEANQEQIDLMKQKTGFDKSFDRYACQINDHASFNFIHYSANPSSVDFNLVFPNLAKEESSKASVAAELIEAFQDNTATLVA